MSNVRTYLKLISFAAIVIFISSCIEDPEENEVMYSPEKEEALIQEYLDTLEARGFDDIQVVGSGVYQIELTEGTGDKVMDGDQVGLAYKGFFVDGVVFDSSGSNLLEFTFSEDANFIKGFLDATAQLNLGAKGLFLIPSSLGYGASGLGTIPPYTPILFELELKELNDEVAPE